MRGLVVGCSAVSCIPPQAQFATRPLRPLTGCPPSRAGVPPANDDRPPGPNVIRGQTMHLVRDRRLPPRARNRHPRQRARRGSDRRLHPGQPPSSLSHLASLGWWQMLITCLDLMTGIEAVLG